MSRRKARAATGSSSSGRATSTIGLTASSFSIGTNAAGGSTVRRLPHDRHDADAHAEAGQAITAVTVSMNFLGDGLNDVVATG